MFYLELVNGGLNLKGSYYILNNCVQLEYVKLTANIFTWQVYGKGVPRNQDNIKSCSLLPDQTWVLNLSYPVQACIDESSNKKSIESICERAISLCRSIKVHVLNTLSTKYFFDDRYLKGHN